MTRAIPLPKRFPGRTVLRAKIWFDGHVVEFEGPVPHAVARLSIAMMVNGDLNGEQLNELHALADKLNGNTVTKPRGKKADAAIRRQLSEARAAGGIGVR